jgi:hypothetical protein
LDLHQIAPGKLSQASVVQSIVEALDVELIKESKKKIIEGLKNTGATYWMLAAKVYVEYLDYQTELDQVEPLV